MGEFIFTAITELMTPVGCFYVSDGQNRLPFSVRKNPYNVKYTIYAPGSGYQTIIEELQTETNYEIVIDTSTLKVGCTYHIAFSGGKLHFAGSDEGTECIAATVSNWSVGLGSYDPNEVEKLSQALRYAENHPGSVLIAYDDSAFKKYNVSRSTEGSGYTFKLLDHSSPAISFKAAWIENAAYDTWIYEDALGFWLT